VTDTEGHEVPIDRDIPTDADLVRATCAGDRAAFGVLVDRHLPSVYGAALRVVGNRATAEDVAQDAFVRAFERLYLYDMAHPLRNWLMKIATNLALNHLRSSRRERILHLNLAERQATHVDASPTTPDLPAPEQWQHWLAQLDDNYRTAVVLFHFHEMPYADIAEVLDVPLNTVRTYIHRGRRRLRELMTAGSRPENGSWNVTMQNG
jgi:RNA polymerase sigma-70 factor (ECF subfamily)